MQENENSSLKSAKTLDHQALVYEGTLEFCKTNKKVNEDLKETKK